MTKHDNAQSHGRSRSAAPTSDSPREMQVQALVEEAERGYDVDAILRRRKSGRPALGSAAATVESVRLDPELKRDLILRAAQEQSSVSEVIRRAIGNYLRAG
jgi:Ribbon-helix-helix protein, copG family